MADKNRSTALSTWHPLNGARVLTISPLPANENSRDTEGAQPCGPSAVAASPHSDHNTQSFQHRTTKILKITSVNIEGLSSTKEMLLASMCNNLKCDILVMQETHRDISNNRPKIDGMKLVLERPHKQYGSAIFCSPDLIVKSTALTSENNIEILTVEFQSCTVTSVYKPPNADYNFIEPDNFNSQNVKIIMGDFNCHSILWGYNNTTGMAKNSNSGQKD